MSAARLPPAARLTPAARRDLRDATRWIRQDSPEAARALRHAVAGALARIGEFPNAGVAHPDLADAPVRFCVVRGFPYVLVYDAMMDPPLILRVLHGARDLPELLEERGEGPS